MFEWLIRRSKKRLNIEPQVRSVKRTDESVGVRSESDREYRLRRIEQITNAAPDDKECEVRKQLDLWSIEVWENETGIRYLPSPLWDDEAALTREDFTSRAEAIAYVESVGGTLL